MRAGCWTLSRRRPDVAGRRIPVRLLGADTHVATAEDTIIAKLEWAKLGESDRQLRDVASILAVNRDTLDHPYMNRWISSLGLSEIWERAWLPRKGEASPAG